MFFFVPSLLTHFRCSSAFKWAFLSPFCSPPIKCPLLFTASKAILTSFWTTQPFCSSPMFKLTSSHSNLKIYETEYLFPINPMLTITGAKILHRVLFHKFWIRTAGRFIKILVVAGALFRVPLTKNHVYEPDDFNEENVLRPQTMKREKNRCNKEMNSTIR